MHPHYQRQSWSNYRSSGADPFAPHQFDPKQVAISQNSIPKVFIMPEAYADQLAIAQLSGSDEIGWLGSVRVISDYQFLIEQIFLIKQVVHGSTTEMTEDGLSDFFTDLAMENPEICSKILFWGHVHPSNSTEPSSQDEDQMKLFAHNDWFLRGIFGRSGRAEFSLFDYKRGVIWKDIPWQIYVDINEDRKDMWKAEIAEKVSSAVVTPINKFPYHGNLPGKVFEIDGELDVELGSTIFPRGRGNRGAGRFHHQRSNGSLEKPVLGFEADFQRFCPGDVGVGLPPLIHQIPGYSIEGDD